MDRAAASTLDTWLTDGHRLPLIVRGARQVGKTWLVRDLASRHGLDLIECNFERDPSLVGAFESNDPQRIIGELGLIRGREVDTATALLFLDEIQAAGQVLPKLRWFAEDMPRLPVIAAGSLLEFTLADHDLSMPVGRVSYMHLHPLSFPEFLQAHRQAQLLETLGGWRLDRELSPAAFSAASDWFGRYVMVGGMPAVVQSDTEGTAPRQIRRRQHDLVAAYIDDFGKYAARVDSSLLVATLRSVAGQLGEKFVYSSVSEGIRSDRARRALELLARARVCHLIRHSAANGLPLGGEVKARNRKAVLLDVGLAHALLGTPANQVFPTWNSLAPPVQGALAEQVLGQQLLSLAPSWEEPGLYYWQRGGGRPGEVDYLLQVDTRIVPIEAKAGATGSLKSLHQFAHDKKIELAVRCDARQPSHQKLDLVTTQGDPARYALITLPHFLVWRLPEAVRDATLQH